MWKCRRFWGARLCLAVVFLTAVLKGCWLSRISYPSLVPVWRLTNLHRKKRPIFNAYWKWPCVLLKGKEMHEEWLGKKRLEFKEKKLERTCVVPWTREALWGRLVLWVHILESSHMHFCPAKKMWQNTKLKWCMRVLLLSLPSHAARTFFFY